MTCIVQKLGFYGEFRLVVTKPDGSYTDTGWIKNIITNDGLDRLGNSYNPALLVCRLGTGTSPPLVTNRQLDAQVAATSTGNSPALSYSNYTYSLTQEYRFNQGSVIGNITEMGVGWSDTGNTLWSRALITDSDGNPTSLNMTSLDQLTVFYRCTIVGPTNTITGTVNISGVEYTYTARASRMSNPIPWSTALGWRGINNISGNLVRMTWANNTQGAGGNDSVIGTIDSSPTNLASAGWGPAPSILPYIAGSKYLDNIFTIPDNYFNFSVGTPSVTGIKTLEIQTTGRPLYQYEFNPIIPKDIQRTLTLSFRFSWDRA